MASTPGTVGILAVNLLNFEGHFTTPRGKAFAIFYENDTFSVYELKPDEECGSDDDPDFEAKSIPALIDLMEAAGHGNPA
jgi:hypothetical protein